MRLHPRDAECTCSETEGDMHSCPYAEDVNDNNDPEYCDCCPSCENECMWDI